MRKNSMRAQGDVTKKTSFREQQKDRPKSILEYLVRLNKKYNVLNELYQDTYTCMTIFRSFPALSKQYVLRLLCLDKGIKMQIIQSWYNPNESGARAAHVHALSRLSDLQVLTSDRDGLISVNKSFQSSLRKALMSQLPSLENEICGRDKHAPTMEHLETYATTKWEEILHFMAGCSHMAGYGVPPTPVKTSLITMGLMEMKDNRMVITSEGFCFLFKDLQTQVWSIVISYMDGLKDRHMNRDDVLRFLFRLSFLKLGQDYSTAALTETQRALLLDLSLFGLIYMRKPNSRRYYPTRLALNLSTSPDAESTPQSDDGYIITETTFKLYAYTTSAFQIFLISKFANILYRLPTMAIASMTKRTCMRAFKDNITSKEIVQYLQAYAHEQIRHRKPIIPFNVRDQISLWEKERQRLKSTPGFLFSDFTGHVEYTQALEYATAKKVVLWKSDEEMLMVTDKKGLNVIREWRESTKNKIAAKQKFRPY